ncbi:hypothetical protein AB2F98_01740 [Escherichia coli]
MIPTHPDTSGICGRETLPQHLPRIIRRSGNPVTDGLRQRR